MITTERLRLRQWTDDDRDAWAALNADPQVMEFFPEPLTREESDRTFDLFRERIDRDGYGWWAVDRLDTGEFIGMIGLVDRPEGLPISPCIEIGWRLAKNAWGHGFATEGAQAALDYGFEQLGRGEIVSFTSHLNERSWKVMERLHMQRLDKTFEHPSVPEGHRLREHIIYRQVQPEWTAYRAATRSGYTIPDGHLPLGLFGDGSELSDQLLHLIGTGVKRATTGLIWEYEAIGDRLQEVGDLELVVDFEFQPRFVIRYTEANVLPFNEVTEEFAAKEGEGDRSLDHWQRVHWEFFSRVCEQLGRTPSETMPVICTEFDVIHTF